MADQNIETRFWVNSEYITSQGKRTYDVHNPADDTLVGTMHIADEHDVDATVAAARQAFEGEWSTFTGAKRAACLLKFADLLEAKAGEIAELESRCMGMPISLMKGMVLPICCNIFRFYAGYADKIEGQTFPIENNTYRIVQYEPIGVCAGICAWNFTHVFLGWKVAPALAAGNTFVFKPSEKSPFSILALAPLFKEAGFPPGVVNFITGDGSTGQLLAAHMDVDHLSVTGSAATGRKVQELAAKSNLKRVTLELGGKSPAILFEDADINNAIQSFAQGFLFNSGEVCFTASRLLVQKTIANAVTAALKGAFEGAGTALGNQLLPETTVGPLADQKQLQRVLSYIEAGKSEAKLLVGGERQGNHGCFVKPTIFIEAGTNAKIYREEIFGPVLVMSTFETEEEAMKMANDTVYGLSACIYTANMSRALRVASKIKAGTVAVNSSFLPDDNTPFGGFKESGYGRESGKQGLQEYLQPKTIKINMAV